MIAYFVDPRPDESFYSIIARQKDHTLSDYRIINKELFGVKNITTNFFYPHHLGTFLVKVGDLLHLTAEDLINDHTALPQYFRFAATEKIATIKNDLLNNKRLVVFHRVKNRTTAIKFCPECLKDDISKYHEPYWHRSHNLNEYILLCTKHNCFLEEWHPSVDDLKIVNFHSARVLMGYHGSSRFNVNDLLSEISIRMVSLVYGKDPIDREEMVSRAIRKGMSKYSKGKFIPNRDVFKEFVEEIRGIDRSYSEQLEQSLEHSGFLIKVFSGNHPLLFALFETLIDRRSDQKIKISGPLLCINRVCDNFQEPAKRDMSAYTNAPISQLFPQRTVECMDCGMSYVAGFSQSLKGKYRRAAYGDLLIEKVKDYLRKGVAISRISKVVGIGSNALKNLVACDFKVVADTNKEDLDLFELEKTKSANRLIWKNELRSKSFNSISESRKRMGPVYSWLLKNDKDWIIEFNKSFFKKKGPQAGKVRIEEEDDYYFSLLKKRKEEILKENVVKRLVKMKLLLLPEFRPIRIKYIDLPKCFKFFNEECETAFEYKLRRLKGYLETTHETPAFNKTFLFNRFGIIVKRLTPRETFEINGLLNQFGYSIQSRQCLTIN